MTKVKSLHDVPKGVVALGTIQVLRHQRGGWVGSENGNF